MRRRRRRRAAGDGLLTALVVLLSLVVGAFISSVVYRWTAAPVPAPKVRDAPPAPSMDRSRIRVEVLNGTRISGLAERVTEALRADGFDVVNYGNAARSDVPVTEILDRMGNAAFAREVAVALPGTPIRRAPAPDGFVDVTVVVGVDHARLFPAASSDGAGGALRDAGGWLRDRISRRRGGEGAAGGR